MSYGVLSSSLRDRYLIVWAENVFEVGDVYLNTAEETLGEGRGKIGVFIGP